MDKFTARFEGLRDKDVLQGEFSVPRSPEDWHPYPSVETKEICCEAFMGSTLPCICGERTEFEALSRYDDGHEDWFFRCLDCKHAWALRYVKVTFRKVE